jgi:hypothetical protein
MPGEPSYHAQRWPAQSRTHGGHVPRHLDLLLAAGIEIKVHPHMLRLWAIAGGQMLGLRWEKDRFLISTEGALRPFVGGLASILLG